MTIQAASRIKLADLRKQAECLGVEIVAVRDDYGWGYWLENTGWDDDNFCSSHGEIEQKLKQIKNGLTVRC